MFYLPACRLRGAFARALALALPLAAALAAPAAADPYVFELASNAEYIAFRDSEGFVRDFGAEVRWGDPSTGCDWEYSVVDGAGVPIGAGNPRHLTWSSSGTNTHAVEFAYQDEVARLALDFSTVTDPAASTAWVGWTPVNTLIIRARAILQQMQVARLAGIELRFAPDADGYVEVLDLDRLIGDRNAEYIGVIDERLAGGFTVNAYAQIADGWGSEGSATMYGFAVGRIPLPDVVPEPGSAALAALAFAGVAVVRRRPRSRGRTAAAAAR